MDTSIVVAALAALAAVTSAVFTWRASRRATESSERVALRQIEADAYKRARESYEGVLKSNEGVLKSMQTEIDRQAAQINVLQRQVARLSRQVRDAGLVPVTSSEGDV